MPSTKKQGTVQRKVSGPLLAPMQHRQRLYELLGYEAYNRFDGAIYDFKL